ncbi:MAG: hypothetical protein A2539_06890 [Elusimicrobia bacterium RIFOXYD2_FULL_34_15]|nr:MAG: hypothetical protein A2539_06890 [Elusimicrobia bacterium RIFOXYD2_FULL_34_15]
MVKRRIIYVVFVFCLQYAILSNLYSQAKVITDIKKWDYIETEHFKIFHYPEEKDILPIVSDICEETFNTTTRFYEYQPAKKISFFIYRNHNEFEQNNIVDVGEGTGGVTEAYKNRFLVFSDGSLKWLDNVIHHEFTHVIQFSVLYEESPVLKALRLARGIFIPLWMMEGAAEYNTGENDVTTREMIIRDMISDKSIFSLKNLSTFSHLEPHQITPAYKISEMAYHFLVDEYGSDKPQAILKVLRDKLDTTASFYDTLNITPALFMKKWEEWIYEEYEDKVKGFNEAGDYGVKLTADNGDNIPDFNTSPAVAPDGGSFVYITDDDGINKIAVMNLNNRKKKIIVKGNNSKIDTINNDKISFSPDGKLLVFTGKKTQQDYIYIYNLETKKIEELNIDLATIRSPNFAPDGKKIVFTGMQTVFNNIYEYNLTDNSLKKITDGDTNIGDPVYSPDGNKLAFFQENAEPIQNDIFILDLKTNQKTNLTNSRANETSPIFSPDGKKIIYTSDEGHGTPVNIYGLDIENREIKKYTNVLTGTFDPVFSSDGRNILFSYYRSFRRDIYMADISFFDGSISKIKTENYEAVTSTSVKKLTSPVFKYRFRPSLDILAPFLVYHSEFGLFLAAYWQASDVLGDHVVTNQIVYASASGELQYAVGYSFSKWRPQFVFSSSGENSEILTLDQEIIKEKQNIQELAVIYPLDKFNQIQTDISTKKYTANNRTLDELLASQRTNRYEVAYERNTITGKYLYARYGSDFLTLFRHAVKDMGGDVEYKEYVTRYEKYIPIFHESALVSANLFVTSEGADRRFFRLPLRGFPHLDKYYKFSRLIASSLEYRFPILTLYKAWPVSDFFLRSINLFLFTDTGYGFNSTSEFNKANIDEVKNSIGGGTRLYTFLAGYLVPLTLEYDKRTDTSGDLWVFSFGVSFQY